MRFFRGGFCCVGQPVFLACGLWEGGFCASRRCRRGGRRATCTNWRRCGKGANVRRRLEVPWAWACVFCRKRRTSLFSRPGRGWEERRGGRGGRSKTFRRSRRRYRGRRRDAPRVLRPKFFGLVRGRGRRRRWFFVQGLS